MFKRAILVFLPALCLFSVYAFQPNRASLEAVAQTDTLVPLIRFTDDVTDFSVNRAIQMIDAANENGAKTIVLEIDTGGGSVTAGQRLSKVIENSPARVVCVVDGMAASMGLYLLQSCDTRIMTRRSLLMAHEPAFGPGVSGKEYAFEEAADALRKLNRAMAEHIAGRMGMPVLLYMAKIANTEWWMTWEEALQVNAVDSVVRSVDEVLVTLR